jgi:6-pyruvoyl-tetrahydropterin synthase related domain
MLNKLLKYRDNQWFVLVCIFIAVCFLMVHLVFMGIPLGIDLTQHLQFASTYQHSILSGDFFPGWAASDNYGFGSIGIRFYPPLAYYLMAFTQMILGSWYDTFWTNAFFWMFLGSLGMYLWAREWLSPIEAATVAIAYAFAPYHRYQIYTFILFAEYAAAGILPFCFLTLTKVIRRGKPIDVLLFSLSLSLLILTHIPTTILGIIGLGIYGLLMMDWKEFPKIIIKLLIAGVISLLASAYHWIKLISELNWVKHTAENYTINFYDFKQHLFPQKNEPDLFTPPIDFAIILLMLSLLPLVCYALIRFKKGWDDIADQKISLGLLITGIISVFMTTSLSLPIWENVTFLQKVQFPWRWLSVGYLMGSFAFVYGVSKLYSAFREANKVLVLIPTFLFSLIFIFFIVITTHSMLPLNRENFATETKNLETRRGCSCWLPDWSQAAAFKNKEKITTESRNFQITKWESETREFEVEPGPGQKIRIATFYYPHWQATLNDQKIEIEKADDGTILLPLSGERTEVKLNFQEPSFVIYTFYISGLVWVIMLGLFIFYLLQKTRNEANFEENV